MNFYHDHTKVIICNQSEEYLLTYINEDRISTTFCLTTLLVSGCSLELKHRMEYALNMLLQRCNWRNSIKPNGLSCSLWIYSGDGGAASVLMMDVWWYENWTVQVCWAHIYWKPKPTSWTKILWQGVLRIIVFLASCVLKIYLTWTRSRVVSVCSIREHPWWS